MAEPALDLLTFDLALLCDPAALILLQARGMKKSSGVREASTTASAEVLVPQQFALSPQNNPGNCSFSHCLSSFRDSPVG